jgi:uncharacterized protein YaaW (UPF0174 family)
MSFERIVKILTDENMVYRNRFIEPIDSESIRKETNPQEDLGAEEPQSHALGPVNKRLQPGMNRQMRKLSPKERVDVLTKIKIDQESRITRLEENMETLTQKAITEELSDREIGMMVKIGDEINKLEIQISRNSHFIKTQLKEVEEQEQLD